MGDFCCIYNNIFRSRSATLKILKRIWEHTLASWRMATADGFYTMGSNMRLTRAAAAMLYCQHVAVHVDAVTDKIYLPCRSIAGPAVSSKMASVRAGKATTSLPDFDILAASVCNCCILCKILGWLPSFHSQRTAGQCKLAASDCVLAYTTGRFCINIRGLA